MTLKNNYALCLHCFKTFTTILYLLIVSTEVQKIIHMVNNIITKDYERFKMCCSILCAYFIRIL